MKRLNLVLVHEPAYQPLDDFEELKVRIERLAPEVEVFIAFNTIPSSGVRKKAAGRPTLVVSPPPLKSFTPARGRVYAGRRIPKPEQCRLLTEAGLPVPKWAVLTPDLALDPGAWGEHVIVKPLAPGTSSRGKGVQLMRTRRVRFLAPKDYPEGHPVRLGPMMVQQFVDTGRRPCNNRVCTLFGEALYSSRVFGPEDRPNLDAPDEELERAVVATNTKGERERVRELHADPEILAFAKRVHAAVPDVPLKGVDVLREAGTGRLFANEFNPGANVWHVSSNTGKGFRTYLGSRIDPDPLKAEALGREAILKQFGFLDVAARVLTERARAEAV